MKKFLGLVGLVIISFILQSTILQFLRILGVTTNLVLVVLVVISLQTDEITGAGLGLMVGFLTDILYAQFFGVNTLLFFCIGYLTGRASEDVYKFDFFTNLYFVLFGTLFYHLFFYFIHYFLKIGSDAILITIMPILTEIALNLIILYPIFRLEKSIFRKLKIN
ncbi:MAG: rod shape-determining protein MreD [Eubacteriales bacterium]|nr:rod shape-determining protein MreD [Eubacteriales bacterium]